jgi:hypothetical protein
MFRRRFKPLEQPVLQLPRLPHVQPIPKRAGTGILFLERLRQEESRFRSLGEFPRCGFLCITSVATEADKAAPFGVIVNILLSSPAAV